MTVRAGLYPGRRIFDHDKQGNPKNYFETSNNLEWDMYGYHEKRSKGWQGRAARAGKVTTKDVIDIHGKQHSIKVYDGFNDYIGFYSHSFGPRLDDHLAIIERAFDKSRPEVGEIITQEVVSADSYVGHIHKLEYAVKEHILKVTFEDGTICSFLGIPEAIAGTLLHIAQSGSTLGVHMQGPKKGLPRHLLGVYFWRYVRIQGQLYGARYPFEYEKHGSSGATDGSRGKRLLRLNSKAGKKVMQLLEHNRPEQYKKLKMGLSNGAITENTDLLVALSDEEYLNALDILAQSNASIIEGPDSYKSYTEDAAGKLYAEVQAIDDPTDRLIAESDFEVKTGMTMQEYKAVLNERLEREKGLFAPELLTDSPDKVQVLRDKLAEDIDLAAAAGNFEVTSNATDGALDITTETYKNKLKAAVNAVKTNRAINEVGGKQFSKDDDEKAARQARRATPVVRVNTGGGIELQIKQPKNMREVHELARAVYGGSSKAWARENNPIVASGGLNSIGRTYTAEQVQQLAKSVKDEQLRTKVQRYVDNNLYEEALNALKGKSYTRTYQTANGVTKNERVYYISDNAEYKY